jgi:hypothetical protein
VVNRLESAMDKFYGDICPQKKRNRKIGKPKKLLSQSYNI